MMRLFRLSLRRELRESYSSPYAAVGEGFALLLSLMIYSLSSKAFMPVIREGAAAPGMEAGYFGFILTGELALLGPLVLFGAPARLVRRWIQERSFDAVVFHGSGAGRPLAASALAQAARVAPRAWGGGLLAWMFFGLRMRLDGVLLASLLQLASLPVFLGLGLIGAALVIRFGRGDSALAHLGSAAAVFSGAYFPLAVLPDEYAWVGRAFMPLTALLDATRGVLFGDAGGAEVARVGAELLGAGALACSVGAWALSSALRARRRSGGGLLGPAA